MSSTPVPPVVPVGDPDNDAPDVAIRPSDDSPLEQPVPKSDPDEEDPNDQLPHFPD